MCYTLRNHGIMYTSFTNIRNIKHIQCQVQKINKRFIRMLIQDSNIKKMSIRIG